MTFDAFCLLWGDQPYFDIAMAAQLSGESRQTLRTQLHRWTKAGKLLSLRRGMYAFSDPPRRRTISPASLSNSLYKPSYLSSYWALGYYGLIPERVAVFTSVTTRVPREFTNDFGVFRYSNTKQSLFFGYRSVSMDHHKVLLAEPEKALLDLWHLERGAWDRARMAGMRFQQMELTNQERLVDYARRFRSPRIERAVEHWRSLAETHDEAVDL
jgi:predicted transcriptional regulator of viral defense system